MEKFDLVIIGSGAAGSSAAVAAADKGLKTIVLEKGRNSGGNCLYTEGCFAINSILQQKMNQKTDEDKVIKGEIEYSKYKADGRILSDYVRHSADNISWLIDHNVKFSGVDVMGDSIPVMHNYGNGDKLIHGALEPYYLKHGVSLRKSMNVISLDKLESGEFKVKIRNEATKKTTDILSNAVLISTGGYLDNSEMMKNETNYDVSRMTMMSSGKQTGDGLRLAWSIGAKKYGTGTAMLFGGYIREKGVPAYKFGGSEMNAAAGQQPFLWVNEDGERFTDESVAFNFTQAGNAMMGQSQVYSVMDSNTVNFLMKKGNYMGLGFVIPQGAKMPNLKDEMEKAVKEGKSFIFKANSVEELAKKMGLPKLTETVEKYNDYAKKGKDEEFGKSVKYIQPITKRPFYGFKLGICAFCTMGGLKIDTKYQVLDINNKPIRGLYAAGDDAAAAIVGDTYDVEMPGSCVGFALYSGHKAANNVAEWLSNN